MARLQLALYWLVFASVIFTTPKMLLAADKISYFPSSTTTNFNNLDASSYQYTPSKSAGYGESFYLNSYDKKGNVVTALISITNYNPFNKGMGSFDINWVENGKTRTVHEEFDADKIYKNAEHGTKFGKFSYLNVNDSNTEIYYRGEDTKGNDVEISLNMKHSESGVQSGDSYLYLNTKKETFWGLKIIAPHGEVKARLKTADKTVTLTLDGYLDHGNATAKVPDFSDHWFRLIFLSENWTINLHEITPGKTYGKRKPQMLYVAKDKQAIGMYADWQYLPSGFKEHDDSPYKPPTHWTLILDREDIKIKGSIAVRNEVLAIDMLDSVNWATQILVKAFYSNAWQHYFLVDVALTIEHNGLIEQVKGLGMATAEYY